ncbi:MAG TPA: replication factor C small subunit [Thermoplasmata archaeon]|nr:replication factor C small subunit [Thermoplasmata archaeon]
MQEIWTEKYRPKTLADVAGQAEIVGRLRGYVKTRNMPHLLFSGRPGTGKTTCAIALARDFYGEGWGQSFLELNASDERKLEVVRTKIKEYARTASLGGVEFKMIFLDEADQLTNDAQSALRRMMEQYSRGTRFILSCNYSSKIIEPIQSRCALFRFRPLGKDDARALLGRIAKSESLEVSEGAMESLLRMSEGDLRRCVTVLQSAAATTTQVDEQVIFEISSLAKPEEVKEMVRLALAGDFNGSRKKLDQLLVYDGVSPEDLVKQLHRSIFDLPGVAEKDKVDIVDKVGEVEFRMTEGSNPRIQLETILAFMVGRAQKK